MAMGLGFGQSTIAGLVTRGVHRQCASYKLSTLVYSGLLGCREMRQLTLALGGKAEVACIGLCSTRW